MPLLRAHRLHAMSGAAVPCDTGMQGSTATRARNERRRRLKARLRRQGPSKDTQLPQEAETLCYNSNRLLRVLAVRDIFAKPPLDQFSLEVLMRRTWIYLDQPLVWQVESGTNAWIDFDDDAQHSLKRAAAASEATTLIRGGNWMYHIDLLAMTQTNLSSNRVRKIWQRDPYMLSCRPGLPTQELNLRLPLWQFQTGHGWSDCNDQVRQALETAHLGGESTVLLPYLGYELNLQAMTQTNLLTGRKRQLRKLPVEG